MLVQEILSAIALAYLLGLGYLANYLNHHISVKVLLEENEISYPNSFIASRSYKHLEVLTGFGPRGTGSDANEIHATNYIKNEALAVQHEYRNISQISIDLHAVSGVHIGSAHYRNVQNVVVKLHGESDLALMLNCHYDSEVGSYGAGDDAVNCGNMLEILRVLAKSGKKNGYSIIFLFNGSEEGNLEGLQASHGFITQQKWAREIRAYINLEGQGIGGRELLFRSGPKHDWLIKKYKKAVISPFGQVFAEEMFELNVLNSRTDFESFRDAGNIPGLDISHCKQGWVYHTKFDHIRYQTLDSIQNTGNNILELTKLLANSEELSSPVEGTSAVYFDLLGTVFVSYTARTGTILNILVSVIAVLLPLITKLRFFGSAIIETLISFATFTASSTLALAGCFLMGLVMNAADRSMFWFNASFLSLGVYSVLAILIQVAIHHGADVLRKILRKTPKKRSKFDERRQIQAHMNGVNLFWAVITIVFASLGLRFVYVSMVMLFISSITTLLVFLLEIVWSKARLHSWILLYFIGHSFTFLWTSYLMLLLWKTFVPISEKSFSSNPELLISLFCGAMTSLTLSYFIPLTCLLGSRTVLYTTLLIAFIVSTILAFTPAGFPYSGNILDPRVQRHYVTHTKRTFYDAEGNIRFTDTGFFIKEHERNTKRTLDYFLDSATLIPKNDDAMCENEAFCGFPSYNETNAFWLKTHQQPNLNPSSLTLTSKVIDGSSVEVNFNLYCRFLVLIFVAPEEGVTLDHSSVSLRRKEWTEGKSAFYLKLTNGKFSSEPFSFSFNLTASNEATENILKITVVTIDSHFERTPKTNVFENLLDKFPDFTFVQTHQADVSSYLF